MTATRTVPEGGLRFVPGVYRYSAGVAAEPGLAGSVLAYAPSGAVRPENPATGPSGSTGRARASSSRPAASTSSAGTPAPPNPPARSPSSSPRMAPGPPRSTTDPDPIGREGAPT